MCESLSKIMIGSAQFGCDYGISNFCGKTLEPAVAEILKYSYSHGIRWIDTARNYGNSESVLGKTMLEIGKEFNIVTKTSNFSVANPGTIISDLENSLSSLKVNKVYGLLVHREEDLLSPKGDIIMNQLADAKASGMVEKIGVSVYSPRATKKILDKYEIDIVQIPCNVFDQRFTKSGIICDMASRGITIHARSLFLQGLLLMDTKLINKYFNPIFDKIISLHLEAKKHNISVLKLALEYIKTLKDIEKIVVGVNNISHISEIISAYEETFSGFIDFDAFCVQDDKFVQPNMWRLS